MKLFMWGLSLCLLLGACKGNSAVDDELQMFVHKRALAALGIPFTEEDLETPASRLPEDRDHYFGLIYSLKENMRRSGVLVTTEIPDLPFFTSLPGDEQDQVARLVGHYILPPFSCWSYCFNCTYYPSRNPEKDLFPRITRDIWGAKARFEGDIFAFMERLAQPPKKDREDFAELLSEYKEDHFYVLKKIMRSLLKLPTREEKETMIKMGISLQNKGVVSIDMTIKEIVKLRKKMQRDQMLGFVSFFSDRGRLNAHTVVKEFSKIPSGLRMDVFTLIQYTIYPPLEILCDEISTAGAALFNAFPCREKRQIFISLFAPENNRLGPLFIEHEIGLVDFLGDINKRSELKKKVDAEIGTEIKRLNWLRRRGLLLWHEANKPRFNGAYLS